MSNIKEQNAHIGSRAFGVGGNQVNLGKHKSGYSLGAPSTGPDSWYSRRSQVVSNVDDIVDDEDDMEIYDEVLECRVFRNEKYQLIETIENLIESDKIEQSSDKLRYMGDAIAGGKNLAIRRGVSKFAKNPVVKKTAKDLVAAGVHTTEKAALEALAATERAALEASVGTLKPSFLSRIPFLGKLAGTAIPVVDIVVGAAFLLSCCKQINEFNKKFNKNLNLKIGSELPNYLVDASEREFDALAEYIPKLLAQNPELKEVLLKDFNSILTTIKDLVMTILVAAQPYATSILGSEVPILGNIIAYAGGKIGGIAVALAVHAIPAERLLFELSAEITDGLLSAINIFESEPKLQEASQQIERNSLAWCFFSSPVQSFARLGKIYEMLDEGPSAIEKSTELATKAYTAAEFIAENSLCDFVYAEDDHLIEDYASTANAFNDKMVRAARKRNNIELPSLEDYIEDSLSEFSGSVALGGGPVPPVGYTSKGKPETRSQRKKRQNFNITKSYPYTSLAVKPKNQKRRKNKK